MGGVEIVTLEGPAWQARVDGRVVGTASSRTGSEVPARFVRLNVEPAARRQGVGGLLLDAVRADAAPSGCLTVEGIAVAGTDGDAFARGRGARLGDELVEDAVALATIDPTWFGAEFPIPDGYELIGWEGRAPEALVGSYAAAKCWIRDAPNRYPPMVPDWDSDSVRTAERGRLGRGACLWGEAAVIEGSRTVVAFSEIEVPDHGGEASQEDTVVLPGHRRRGLATAVKAALLTRVRLRSPEVTRVSVTCAVANTGMRTVNHRLGFREVRRRNLYRLGVT